MCPILEGLSDPDATTISLKLIHVVWLHPSNNFKSLELVTSCIISCSTALYQKNQVPAVNQTILSIKEYQQTIILDTNNYHQNIENSNNAQFSSFVSNI